MSLYPTSRTIENLSPATESQHHSELKQQIKNFLESAAAKSNQRQLCARCGALMTYIDMSFSLMGTNSTWKIKLPLCGCTAPDAERNSNDGRKQTDDPQFDAGRKKPSAA